MTCTGLRDFSEPRVPLRNTLTNGTTNVKASDAVKLQRARRARDIKEIDMLVQV